MTRRETPSRHGRAADALIATYVRELLADDDAVAAPNAAAEQLPAALDAAPAAADATL